MTNKKFFKQRIELFFTVPPLYLQNIEEFVNLEMDKYLLKYSEMMDGLILFYRIKGLINKHKIDISSGNVLVRLFLDVYTLKIKFYNTLDINTNINNTNTININTNINTINSNSNIYKIEDGKIFGIFNTNIEKSCCLVNILKIDQNLKDYPFFNCKEIDNNKNQNKNQNLFLKYL